MDSDVFGVGLERELRAEKYALAVKLRDTRVSVEKLRLQAAAGESTNKRWEVVPFLSILR